jgi:hypothetical protein
MHCELLTRSEHLHASDDHLCFMCTLHHLPVRLLLFRIVHCQVFCGITSRVWQFSDILLDAKQHQQLQLQQQQQHAQSSQDEQQQQQQGEAPQQSEQQQPSSSNLLTAAATSAASTPCCQAILGDLNTMAHSVARLSPNYCCDGMRWRSLGSSEAAWWQRYVLAVMGELHVMLL